MKEKEFPLHRSFTIYPEIKKKFKLSSDQYQVIERNRERHTCLVEFENGDKETISQKAIRRRDKKTNPQHVRTAKKMPPLKNPLLLNFSEWRKGI